MSSETLQVTLGGLLVSVLISTFIYAITCLQSFLYWRSNFRDQIGLRILVWVVWIIETVHTICFWIYLFKIVVTYYGVPDALNERHWSVAVSVTFHGVITSCVESYYAYRVYVLSGGRKFIPLLCWIGCLIECFGSIAISIILQQEGPVEFERRMRIFPMAIIALDLTVDIINTTTLCYYLYTRKTGVKKTDQLVTTLIEYSVETGLITALAALGMLIACIVTPATGVYISITSFYAKFYSNSLLASLNGRSPLSPFRPARQQATTTTTTIGAFDMPSFAVQLTAPSTGINEVSRGNSSGLDVKSRSPGERDPEGDTEQELAGYD